MTHSWKVMNHTKILDQKKGVIFCLTAKNNFFITVHWNVGDISDFILVQLTIVLEQI